MPPALLGLLLLIAVLASLWFSTLTYSLRDLSRKRFEDFLRKRGKAALLEPIADHVNELVFVTAVLRLISNFAILIVLLRWLHYSQLSLEIQYTAAIAATLALTLFVSVTIPNALGRYAGDQIVSVFADFLNLLGWVFSPIIKLMHAVDSLVRRATGASDKPQEEHIEQEILSAVEEGTRGGVVDEKERRMIESVIGLDEVTVNQIMTARPEMKGINSRWSIEQIKQLISKTGLSRLPVYEETFDRIIGVLYVRDLLKYLGRPLGEFDLKATMRPAFFVPETRALHTLLDDFRARKVHMAIVLDEYGGTAGLVTIEDILEELVGEISDEHEPAEPANLKKIDDKMWEADARVYLDEVNQHTGLKLPEDSGYDTLGGYITTSLGHIPTAGEVFSNAAARFVTIDAEPQRIKRVRIELIVNESH